MAEQKTEAFLKEAKELVASALADGTLDASEVLRIAIFVAEKVNVLKDLSGVEKKALVLHAVEEAVKAVVPPELAERVGSSVALQVLPSVLDIAVSAARGKIFLGQVVGAQKKVSWGCLLGCLGGFLSGRKNAGAVEPAAQAPPAPAPAAVEPSPSESATQEPESHLAPAPPSPPEESPKQESQTEPSPAASAVVAPLETRPPEETSVELPNTATPVEVKQREEVPVVPESVLEPPTYS